MKNFFALFFSVLVCSFIYAQPGKLISQGYYVFNTETGDQVSGDSLTVSYNGQLLPDGYRNFKYDLITGFWALKSRSTDYQYDVNGNLLSHIRQNGNDTDGWINTWRYSSTYNANNQQLTYALEKWDGANWVPNSLSEYVYDANGLLISLGGPISQRLFTYNAEGLLETETLQYISNGIWVNSTKETYVYYPNSSLVETQLSSDWISGAWNVWNRKQFQYDANGNNVESVSEYLIQNQWTPGFRTTMEYDTENNMVYWVSGDWDGDSWEDDTRQFSTYDQNNNFTSARFELLDSTGWQMATFGRLHYGALSGVQQAELTNFVVFPNPAVSSITLQGENLESAQIIDRQGQLVNQITLNQHSETNIPVSHLAQGMYFIQVTHANGEKGIKPVFIRGK
jgi:hypothetical protein